MVDTHKPINSSHETIAATRSGYVMLAVFIVLLGAIIGGISVLAGSDDPSPGTIGSVLAFLLPAILVQVLIVTGFYMIQPNQAVAITLFGSYRGTDRNAGLRWMWPWMSKTKIAVRANNVVSEKLKVNDLRGNPIEIATNVVWRVADTAQALYDVDDYRTFVNVQIEAAVRSIGSRYAYDDVEDAEITLRGSHEEVNAQLRAELIARLQVAGLTVDECGLTHLAYAPEIAGAMLRRQQAEAVIGARRKLVEGAVSMVEMALTQLSEKNVVELDDERRAAMVSNLMVVLCGEREAQPIVNTGTLYS